MSPCRVLRASTRGLQLEWSLIVTSRFAALFTGLLVVLSLLQPTHAGPSLPGRPDGAKPMSRMPRTATCAAKPDTLQQMFVPLAHLRYFNEAEIVLNNNGIDQMVVRPTWFVHGASRFAGAMST
jgi:hypothetical protein